MSRLRAFATPLHFSGAIGFVAVLSATLLLADAIAGSELYAWAGEFTLTLAFSE